jgi:hypothetical protein
MSRATALCAVACAVALGSPARVAAAPDLGKEEAPGVAPPDAVSSTTAPQSAEASPIADGVRPDDKIFEEFDRHWNEGRRLFGRKEFARAAVEFERACAAVPAADALYNVVISYAEDGDLVAAATAAQRYVALAPCDGDVDPIRCASRSDEVAAMYTDLKGRVVELSLDVSAGVTLREIRINGRIVAPKSFPIYVDAGTVEIELVGSEPGQRVVREPKLRPGETYVVRATPFRAVVESNGPTNGSPGTPPKRERNTKALKRAFYGGIGFTAASGVALAVIGGLTPWAKREFEKNNGGEAQGCFDDMDLPKPCEDPYPNGEDKRYHRMRLSTNILIGVTAGLALTTAIIGVFAFSKPRQRAGNQRASTKVQLRPSASGLTLSF